MASLSLTRTHTLGGKLSSCGQLVSKRLNLEQNDIGQKKLTNMAYHTRSMAFTLDGMIVKEVTRNLKLLQIF